MNITKKAFISSLLATGLLTGAVGVYAADGVSLVKAYLNSTIKFTVDGTAWTPKDASGKKLSPLVYNGSTYLPAKAVGEALSAEVLWNGNTKTVEIKTTSDANAGIPYNDAATTAPVNNTPVATNAPVATAPPASSAPTPSTAPAASAGRVPTLPAKYDENAAGSQLKPIALEFTHAYSKALSSGGSTAALNALIDKYMTAGKDSNAQYCKERIAEEIAEEISGQSSSVSAEDAAYLAKANLNDIKFEKDSYKNNESSSANIYFTLGKPLYSDPSIIISQLDIKFVFNKLDSGSYILDSIVIWS
ncbi:stalk domain-containing protein [Paenibacillus donghaensis]|uniref:stalk domain-containing protein n=1 Tax=Paenibacillus donghaensis TaxID=414771 RepID=UPI0012F97799|nr:stalk domain-containing protein [Paenibacillus donghaensis]